MKNILVVTILSFVFFNLSAQDDASIPGRSTGSSNTGKFFIQATSGLAFPMGEFGNTDNTVSEAGYANIGVNVGLDAGYVILEDSGIGIGGNLSITNHPITEINQGTVRSSYWSYQNLLVGPMFMTNSGNILLEAHALFGPSVSALVIGDPAALDVSTTSVAAMFGGNLKAVLGKTFFITVGADYLAANPEFEIATVKIKKDRSTLNLEVGIGFAF